MLITRLIYPLGLKALSPMPARKSLCRSGVKSQLRGPVNPEKVWQATITMIRFTKLIRDLGLTLGGGRNITGNGPSLMWAPSRMYGSPRINIKRFCNMAANKISQRSKVIHDVLLGTMGNPKRLKSHGFGGLVVGSLVYSSRRGPEIRQLHSKRGINLNGGAPLKTGADIATGRLTKVIHDIASLKNITRAYESIKSKPGNMTPGASAETLDGIGLAWVVKASDDLKAGKFSFSNARRVSIPKSGNSKSRPLGVINPRDKVILTAMLQVLEPFYESKFLDCSHGFRPAKGCHTALKSIQFRFGHSSWVIEGDIAKCFDDIDHNILLGILRRDINCEKTIALINRSLKNPYEDQGIIVKPKKGTFQGSPLSPLLCNIYLHEMDLFIEGLSESYTSGVRRRKLPKYRNIQYELTKSLGASERKRLNIRLRNTQSKDPLDPDFRRFVYVRYADDFVIGISGPKKDCEVVRDKLKAFLTKTLALELSMEKTLISHFNQDGLNFLGTRISGNKEREKVIRKISKGGKVLKVRTSSRARLEAPIEVLLERGRANGLFKRLQNGRVVPTGLGRVVNLDHSDILKFFNQKIRGILNYYSFADNAKSLGIIVHGMKHSCALTLSLKYKLRNRAKAFKKFGKYLECKESGTKLFIPSSFSRTKSNFQINPPTPDAVLDAKWNNKLTHSNLNKGCLVCGETPSEMHHVRKIKDLKARYARQEIDFWTLQMAAINRKQIPLCKAHHLALHKGTLTQREKELLKESIENLK